MNFEWLKPTKNKIYISILFTTIDSGRMISRHDLSLVRITIGVLITFVLSYLMVCAIELYFKRYTKAISSEKIKPPTKLQHFLWAIGIILYIFIWMGLGNYLEKYGNIGIVIWILIIIVPIIAIIYYGFKSVGS
ncbi:MAG: hypothetical protein AABX33_08180 [Nanoarchaeota archaeon]